MSIDHFRRHPIPYQSQPESATHRLPHTEGTEDIVGSVRRPIELTGISVRFARESTASQVIRYLPAGLAVTAVLGVAAIVTYENLRSSPIDPEFGTPLTETAMEVRIVAAKDRNGNDITPVFQDNFSAFPYTYSQEQLQGKVDFEHTRARLVKGPQYPSTRKDVRKNDSKTGRTYYAWGELLDKDGQPAHIYVNGNHTDFETPARLARSKK